MDVVPPPTLNILETLRDRMISLYQTRLHRVILFGSQARGDASPDSDLDILVVLQDEVDSWTEIKRTGEIIAELCLQNNILINSLFISLDHYSNQNTALLRNINQDGVVICQMNNVS